MLLRNLFPQHGNYAGRVLLNKLNNFFRPNIENKHLFVLSPPYCGSTLLNELISTSSFVSVNNPRGTREGQLLPTVRKMMFNEKTRWNDTIDFDWKFINKEWRKYWDTSKPILLEKSPPNIIRAKSISQAFSKAFFIVFYRNPYCQCESLIRRNKYSATQAAKFAMKCLNYQKENILILKNTLVISYEELTDNPNDFVEQIRNLMPELTDIKTDIEFSAHNFKNRPLKINNLNAEKIDKLSQRQLDEINEVFCDQEELLKYFNYEIMTSSKSHFSHRGGNHAN